MNEFTQEEIKNILALISIAPIKGQEATTVALLQQKLTTLLTNLAKNEGIQNTPKGDKTATK